MSSSRGFTLIELLIVIAIIGILSGTILVSLNTARNKGADAAIKKELSTARRMAELYNDVNGRSYENVCSDTAVNNGITSINPVLVKIAQQYNYTVNIENLTGSATRVTCNDSATEWAAEVPLRTGGFFCVDWRGDAAVYPSSRVTGCSGVCDTKC